MSNKKEALGKGIRALLENIDSDIKESPSTNNLTNIVAEIPLVQIEVNPFQPRAEFDENALRDLSNSVKVHGVIQPITVRKIGNKKYQLIAGERRLRASKMAGLTQIPAYIRTANDQETLEIALIENIQRENLNAMEIAVNYKRLMDECTLTQEQLSNRVSKDRSTVTNYLRLLKLPPDIQLGIKNRKISMGHARAIITIEDPIDQIAVYKNIIKNNLSVRKVEELVKKIKETPQSKKTIQKSLPLEYKKLQENLTTKFATKVMLKVQKNGKGSIQIPFYSDDDLERILEIIES